MHNRRRIYLASLAVASVAILTLGVWLRPERTPAPVISEAERQQLQVFTYLQSLTRRTELMSTYVRDLVPRLQRVRQEPASVQSAEMRTGEMLVLVTSDGGSGPRWIMADYVGTQPGPCGLNELYLSAEIPRSFINGVAFNLTQTAAGIVAHCDGRLSLVRPADFARLEAERPARSLWECCGLKLAPDGTRILELRTGSAAQVAGLEAGDEVLSINGTPASTSELTRALQSAEFTIQVRRSERILELRPPRNQSFFRLTSAGVEVIRVEPGSPAARAGLRPRDVVIRVGDTRRPAVAAVERALSQVPVPMLVVVRGERHILVEVPHE